MVGATVNILSFWDGPNDSPYARLARVLEYSARRFHANVGVVHMYDKCANRSEAFGYKVRHWLAAMNSMRSDGLLCFLDTDTFLQYSLHGIEGRDFDIAITTHRGDLNSGVLFVRPSDKVLDFFAHWPFETDRYCARNPPGEIRYGDQDALADMLTRPHDLNVLRLPMTEWNSTQRTWQINFETARIVHVKSDARAFIFKDKPCAPIARRVAERWLTLEKEALKC